VKTIIGFLTVTAIVFSCTTFQPNIDGKKLITSPSSSPGKVIKIVGIKSQFLELPRNLYVYLPHGYDEENSNYPVIYIQDGNNLFSKSASSGHNWKLDLILNNLIESKIIPKVIVIGIGNTANRSSEYEPYVITAPKSVENLYPIADKYLKFVCDELIPYVESNFRVIQEPKSRTIGGSSYGGTFSLYAAIKRPEMFGTILALSPSLWPGIKDKPGDEKILQDFENAELNKKQNIYFDLGAKEGPSGYIEDVSKRLITILEKSLPKNQIKFVFDPNGEHGEEAWTQRIPDALSWIFSR